MREVEVRITQPVRPAALALDDRLRVAEVETDEVCGLLQAGVFVPSARPLVADRRLVLEQRTEVAGPHASDWVVHPAGAGHDRLGDLECLDPLNNLPKRCLSSTRADSLKLAKGRKVWISLTSFTFVAG